MSPIPAHVPPDLVRDFDFVDTRGEPDVYRHFQKLHDGPDIIYSPHHGGHWVATRYADMESIFNNAADFSSRHQTLPPMPSTLSLIEWDGSMHAESRQLLAPFFSPPAIRNLEKMARERTVALIDGFYAHGECDFVQEFSLKMPINIMMRFLAFPLEDTPHLLQIADDIVRSVTPSISAAAFGRAADYIAQKIVPARRSQPGDDIFSAILRARVDSGRPYDDAEVIGFGILLIAAGLDTVATMLGFIAGFLADHPAHRQRLVDNPNEINEAIDEFLRRFHLANLSRVVRRDLDYKGIPFKAGDLILLPTTAAGIDPRRFPDPFTVDFKRADKKPLVFGAGPHQCLGLLLARTELRVFLQEWLTRIPNFTIKAGHAPVVGTGRSVTVRSLPLTWGVS